MPKKTKKQKIIAAYRQKLQQLTQEPTVFPNSPPPPTISTKQKPIKEPISPVLPDNSEDQFVRRYFLIDLKKSGLIIFLIIALEFSLYFATINNYLSRFIKY